MLPKNYCFKKILVVFSFFEIFCTRVGNSERFGQGESQSVLPEKSRPKKCKFEHGGREIVRERSKIKSNKSKSEGWKDPSEKLPHGVYLKSKVLLTSWSVLMKSGPPSLSNLYLFIDNSYYKFISNFDLYYASKILNLLITLNRIQLTFKIENIIKKDEKIEIFSTLYSAGCLHS